MDFNKFCENGKKLKLTKEKKAEIINVCQENKAQKTAPFSPNFKRIAAAVCAMIIAVTAVFVYKNYNNANDILTRSSTYQSETEHSKVIQTTSVQFSQIIENTTENDIGGGSISTRKYRVNYYDVPYQFVLIVGEDVYWEWDEQYNNENPDETNVMVMKRFIEYFDISKESFEKANLEWAKVILNKMGSQPNMNPKDFANQETDEVYNADIIYTFDDEIINEYYISGYYPYIYESDFEEAVKSGEYVSQTKDWIDIEQMEAEIIAKYGEAEIVTEVTGITTIPEETTATDLAQIETNE